MIITKQDINDYCRACTTDDSIANGHIYDVESAIIRPALGVTLYNNVEANPVTYKDLLYGCDYTNEKGETVYQDGLKRAEAYYAYARIIRGGNASATRYGYVQKNGDYSQTVTDQQIARDSSQITAQADLMLRRVVDFCIFKNYVKKDGTNTTAANINGSPVRVFKIGE